jgi:hypothetical protein
VEELDSPWKELLAHKLPEVLQFFRSTWYEETDWAQDHESLEQELRKLAPEGVVGKRIVDHLVKLMLKDGDVRYAHLEVQGRKQRQFRRRMWLYNSRLSDFFGVPVASLAILLDDDPKWRPRSYREATWDTSKVFRFPVVKVLDWATRLPELEQDANPVALFVLAHLQGQATRKRPQVRKQAKVSLLRLLAERKLDEGELGLWYRWFDWLLPLPKELNRQAWLEARKAALEAHMPFVTAAERYGREEGFKEGRDAGRKEGLDAGRKEALLKGAELALELKFKEAGLALMPELRAQQELAVLEKVFAAIKTADAPDDLRRLLQPTQP